MSDEYHSFSSYFEQLRRANFILELFQAHDIGQAMPMKFFCISKTTFNCFFSATIDDFATPCFSSLIHYVVVVLPSTNVRRTA